MTVMVSVYASSSDSPIEAYFTDRILYTVRVSRFYCAFCPWELEKWKAKLHSQSTFLLKKYMRTNNISFCRLDKNK